MGLSQRSNENSHLGRAIGLSQPGAEVTLVSVYTRPLFRTKQILSRVNVPLSSGLLWLRLKYLNKTMAEKVQVKWQQWREERVQEKVKKSGVWKCIWFILKVKMSWYQMRTLHMPENSIFLILFLFRVINLQVCEQAWTKLYWALSLRVTGWPLLSISNLPNPDFLSSFQFT